MTEKFKVGDLVYVVDKCEGGGRPAWTSGMNDYLSSGARYTITDIRIYNSARTYELNGLWFFSEDCLSTKRSAQKTEWQRDGDMLLHDTVKFDFHFSDMFNFAAGERVLVVKDIATKNLTGGVPQPFCNVADDVLEEAATKFAELGGVVKDGLIGRTVLKYKDLRPGS